MWNRNARPILPKPDYCRSCEFWSVTHFQDRQEVTYTGEGFVRPEGYPALGVAFCGEAAGRNEEEDGLPLRPFAQGGSIHTRALRALGITRKQVLQFNVLSCRPPNNKLQGEWYESSVIGQCAQHRNPIISGFQQSVATNPSVRQGVIVALGEVAFRTLTGLAGDKLGIAYTRGYPIRTPYGLVVGTFDPYEVRRHLKHLGVLIGDYAKALMYAREGFREFPRDYQNANERNFRDFRDRVKAMAVSGDPSRWLSFDFETTDIVPNMPKGTWPELDSIQFSLEPGKSLYVDINRETFPVVAEILASNLRKVTHNGWDFDVPLAHFHKLPIGGIVDDSLWMFHHWQPDLVMEDAGAEADTDFRFSTSASLQFVASFFGMDFIWKHLRLAMKEVNGVSVVDHEARRFYANADVDATSRIVTGLPPAMKAVGVWNGYERYVREFYPILQRMAERGLPINRKSQFEFAQELEKIEVALDQKIQKIHPDELKMCAPQHGYVNGPKEGEKIRVVGDGWEWWDEGEDMNYPGRDNDALDEEEGDKVVSGVWRQMVQRTFVVTPKEKQRCGCGKFVPNIGKTGKPLKSGKWIYDVQCSACWGKGQITIELPNREETRWVRLLPFRTSQKQLLIYIHAQGHKPPKVRGKITTAAKGIQDLAKKTKDPLYQSILDIRTVSKISSTYVTGRGWMDRDEHNQILPIEKQSTRIHSSPTLGPATGQTSTRRPNIQNAPKHVRNENLKHLDLIGRFRRLIQARPNHRIWEFDLKSAHALTLGLEAKCTDYMRLARMDVHTYMASHLATKRKLIAAPIDLSMSDADLKAALKAMRAMRWDCTCSDEARKKGKVEPSCHGIHLEADIRDVQAKPAILGYGFGMRGPKLRETNKESFETDEEAQAVLDLIDVAFPPLKKYREETLAEAHQSHYLVARGGFIRWFWHVYDFTYDRFDQDKWKAKHGDDAEDALAFRPANTAFVYMRDAELRLEEMGVNEVMNFINVVHDSNVFEPERDRPMFWLDPISPTLRVYANLPKKDEELAFLVKQEMERAQPALGDPDVAPGGLSISCDIKCGLNWGEMEEVKL